MAVRVGTMAERHLIRTAELLAVGSELLVGETRDTNGGDLARELTTLGVEVTRITALPDDLATVTEALAAARARVDLVITSGGLGPTPDDLTREAVAALLGVTPHVDPGLETWLRDLWARRGQPFPETNLKQAWLVPGAEPLANPNGTAPGWWLDLGDSVMVTLPGPPRELLPMWTDEVLPRLRARGLGMDRAAATLRLTGIGESAVADLLGEEVLRGTHPHVATYARLDAVDVRVWATGDANDDAATVVAAGLARVERLVGPYVFARGEQTWPEVLGARLRGRQLATLESGTGGQLAALLGDADWLRHAEVVAPMPDAAGLAQLCAELRTRAGTPVALAVVARADGDDLAVEVTVDVDGQVTTARRTAFRGGEIGRRRAATLACAELWQRLGG
jgi:nicotinamide-nucleotide amidase